jgi:hypothetical protein
VDDYDNPDHQFDELRASVNMVRNWAFASSAVVAKCAEDGQDLIFRLRNGVSLRRDGDSLARGDHATRCVISTRPYKKSLHCVGCGFGWPAQTGAGGQTELAERMAASASFHLTLSRSILIPSKRLPRVPDRNRRHHAREFPRDGRILSVLLESLVLEAVHKWQPLRTHTVRDWKAMATRLFEIAKHWKINNKPSYGLLYIAHKSLNSVGLREFVRANALDGFRSLVLGEVWKVQQAKLARASLRGDGCLRGEADSIPIGSELAAKLAPVFQAAPKSAHVLGLFTVEEADGGTPAAIDGALLAMPVNFVPGKSSR